MGKTFKIPFAYTNNGQVIDIESAVKGEDYSCSCGSIVRLRGGEIVSNHFYHVDESQCSLESAIHKAYKSVFNKIQAIRLPYEIDGVDLIVFDKVELEKKIDDYVPDAIGYKDNKRYLIEFAKSSYIGERKEKKIKKSNLFCLEVDIIKTVTSIHSIENHLINDRSYKHIIHIPEYKEMIDLREKYAKEYRKIMGQVYSLKAEIVNLKSKNKKYKETLIDGAGIKELEDLALFYKMDCRNGAKLYKRTLPSGDEIVAFQKGGVINIKFNGKFKSLPRKTQKIIEVKTCKNCGEYLEYEDYDNNTGLCGICESVNKKTISEYVY